MTRPAVRIVVVLLLIIGIGVAGWQAYELEMRRIQAERQRDSLSALREQIVQAIAEARTAQQAYLAEGQGRDHWEAEFAEAHAALTQGLATLKERAIGQPAALAPLEDAGKALDVYGRLDAKIRGFVANGTTLMAADAVYEDGIKTTGLLRTRVEEALTALRESPEWTEDDRRMQYFLAGGAAGAGVLVALLLLPTGRREEPAVEILAPTSSLHLNERARPEPSVTSSAADTMRPSATETTPAPKPTSTPRQQPAPVAHEAPRAAAVVSDEALEAAARVCTDLARVKDADELRDALGRAARLLDASGVIVWMTDAAGQSLKPLLTYGYPDEALRRIPTLPREADNATAAAWRDAVTHVVDATESAPGAIAVPLMMPQGCVGVFAAEIGHGREAALATRALAQIVAAQLAVLIPSEQPQAETPAESAPEPASGPQPDPQADQPQADAES